MIYKVYKTHHQYSSRSSCTVLRFNKPSPCLFIFFVVNGRPIRRLIHASMQLFPANVNEGCVSSAADPWIIPVMYHELTMDQFIKFFIAFENTYGIRTFVSVAPQGLILFFFKRISSFIQKRVLNFKTIDCENTLLRVIMTYCSCRKRLQTVV
ncbi:uncharacterized protein LOC134253620 [Saccostrea cucullata]|uniref:uncharacterized protein LOC134253620 n=1 Tax=Saccostrea cuccullata TaxID=36930 RepID=UPI002ED2D822